MSRAMRLAPSHERQEVKPLRDVREDYDHETGGAAELHHTRCGRFTAEQECGAEEEKSGWNEGNERLGERIHAHNDAACLSSLDLIRYELIALRAERSGR
jgi:hypothetical protein